MAKLYLDSTDHIVVGLIDHHFRWKSYNDFPGGRNAQHIHQKIYAILESHGLQMRDIDEIIQSSGPAPYTAMRLAEGISQVCQWQGMRVCNFYHFEVAQILGVKKGVWFSKAYKAEIFLHRWGQEASFTGLIKEKDFSPHGESLYTHFPSFPIDKVVLTSKMIEENPENFLSTVSQRGLRHSPYYYRRPEHEFKIPR